MLKYFYYIRYFVYIAWNWNVQLALFTIYHEIRGERKYNLSTSRLSTLAELSLTGPNFTHAEIYQGASYFLLEQVFARLRTLHQTAAFTDVGCGRGRALAVAIHHGYSMVTGIDFAEELCRESAAVCRKLLTRFPETNYRIVHADAAGFVFDDWMDLVYFFNPFDETVMRQVLNNLLLSLQKKPRALFVVYINPQYKHLFILAGFTEVYYLRKIQYVEACILKKPVK